MANVLNFGGGGFVGTAYMLGSLLAFDQVLVVPELGIKEKKSFFDYVDDAKVPFKQLEFRVEEVIDAMPLRVLLGDEDAVSRAFSVAQGISGGSLLAWSMLGDAPMVNLIKTMLEFDAAVYLRPNTDEFKDFVKAIPSVIKKVAGRNYDFVRDLLAEPLPRDKKSYLIRSFSDLLFDVGRAVKDILPSGFCTGGGLENYVSSLCNNGDGLPCSFDELKNKGKQLIIMAERLNYVELLKDKKDVHESVLYFGIPPYDDVSIAKAIRASCSLPLLVAPTDFFDPVLNKYVQLLDGGIAKTVGFRKIKETCQDIKLWAVFNPIVPQDYEMHSPVDIAEQVIRKFVYNRKCALWDQLDNDIKDKTILFEADKDFTRSFMAWPDMKRAFWHGYWHGLEMFARNYDDVNSKLNFAGLSLAPPSLLEKYVDRNDVRKKKYL